MKNFEQIGVVGVDSGQLMICDPCYIKGQWQVKEYGEKHKDGEFSYPGVCSATNSKLRSGQLNYSLGHAGVGVAFSSGYGDGTYPVYAKKNKEGMIVEVKIIMK